MLFLKPKMEFVLNSKRILWCFELASGLKINFHKSSIVRVAKDGGSVSRWAAAFKCKSDSLPISYLGLPLGARPSSKAFWNSVVNKVENRLAPWKRKFLSKSGRLVLIKSVLGSIPTYFLSVFKVLVGIAQKIEKVQRSFLWGDGLVKRKLHAVDWVTVCKNKRNGGLGIGRIVDKKNGLLTKWVWRFGNESDALWKRVICAKYRVDVKSLSWNWQSQCSPSVFVRGIAHLFNKDSNAAKVLENGLRVEYYCYRFNCTLLERLESNTHDLEKIDILEVIRMVVAWTFDVKPSTIANCFLYCRIRTIQGETDEDSEDSGVMSELEQQIQSFHYSNHMDVNHLLNHSVEEEVRYTPTKKDIIHDITRQNKDGVVEINDDDDDSHNVPKISTKAIVASPFSSDRRRIFFPSRIHRMKIRSGLCGCNFSGFEDELVDRITKGKDDDKC
ncbi:hypothetical protein Dsin_012655 [Dipteronia sinensis]|uniref:Uncharacterized protein n=1 Tax=Dipteronia sinensis TaxID=43782 RepID=A0AAE0AJC2_9ROSI|nr:hypothetical protein Dsin_012655 [Dipteronia sinensis]